MEPPVAGPSASRLRALLDRPAVQALLFAACYYALCRLGDELTVTQGEFATFWPASA